MLIHVLLYLIQVVPTMKLILISDFLTVSTLYSCKADTSAYNDSLGLQCISYVVPFLMILAIILNV